MSFQDPELQTCWTGLREVKISVVRWHINSQIDEAENTADKVKDSESIYPPLLKTIIHAWLILVLCSTTHELHAIVKTIYLVQTELTHSVCVQAWTFKKRNWETHKPLHLLSVNVLAQLILTVLSNTIVFPKRFNCSNAKVLREKGDPGHG